MTVATKVIHLMALALWMGSLYFFLPVALTIFGLSKTTPPVITRRVAGDITGAIFPAYFWVQVIAGILALVTAIPWARGPASTAADRVRAGLLLIALGVLAVQSTVVYAQSVRSAERLHRAEDAGDAAQVPVLQARFGLWHGISRTLNLLILILVTVVVCMTATMLKTP